jgi:hypothetical protein
VRGVGPVGNKKHNKGYAVRTPSTDVFACELEATRRANDLQTGVHRFRWNRNHSEGVNGSSNYLGE